MKRIAAVAAFALLAAGCGLREPLQPAPGQALPPARPWPQAADHRRIARTPPLARPDRVDELLRRSEEREDDRFDLPPPE